MQVILLGGGDAVVGLQSGLIHALVKSHVVGDETVPTGVIGHSDSGSFRRFGLRPSHAPDAGVADGIL